MSPRAFTIRFLALALPLTLGTGALHLLDLRVARDAWRKQTAASLAEGSRDLASELHDVAADTLALAASTGLDRRISPEGLDRLAGRMHALARFKPDYHQVRFLDMRGRERIRFNTGSGGTVRVPDRELQDKSARDYFQEAIKLSRHSVRLSRLDLNIEHGRIERPLRPMLRFSAPVFAEDGTRLGVVVINLAIGRLLTRVESLQIAAGTQAVLVNAGGAFLAGGDPAKRWGDLLGTGAGLAKEDPEALRRLTSEAGGNGHFVFGDREQAFVRLRPHAIVSEYLSGIKFQVGSAEPGWTLLATSKRSAIDAGPRQRLRIAAAAVAFLLASWALVLSVWQRLRSEAKQAMQQERRLARIVEQTTDLVVMTNARGQIQYVNPAFCALTGYSAEETLGKTPALLKSGYHDDAFYRRMWGELVAGQSFRELLVNRRKDGELFYVEQEISPLLSERGIAGFFSTGKDVTRSRTTRLAFYDQLSGLVNRALFLDRLQHQVESSQRTGATVALLYMDLDGFKAINDSIGHHGGDQALRQFAERVAPLVRKTDTLARLGGDEFAILMQDCASPAGAESVAEKILEVMRPEWRIDGHVVPLGVSIGISFGSGPQADSARLLTDADTAMYRAKRQGRNRFVVFCQESETES